MFQSSINRNYAQGFPGEIAQDGPLRVRPARIASVNDPAGVDTNRVGRVFTFAADIGNQSAGNPLWPNATPAVGGTSAVSSATEVSVNVGGTGAYAGILINPKHYALYGTAGGGPLAASYDLPQFSEGEFATMAILYGEIYNDALVTKNVNFGDLLFYVNASAARPGTSPLVPLGGIVSYPTQALATASVYGTAGLLTPIPGGVVTNSIVLAAGVAATVPTPGVTKFSISQ